MEKKNYIALLDAVDESSQELAFEMARNQPELQLYLQDYISDQIKGFCDGEGCQINAAEVISKAAIKGFEANIKAYFTDIFGVDFIEEHFVLPIDFEAYLNLGQGFYEKGWRSVYPYDLIQQATVEPHYDFEIEDLKERVKKNCLLENDTIWLCIGYWSDKHDYLICCDQKHPYFGKVFDYNDAFPYGGYGYESYCSSFVTFMKSFAGNDSWKY